MALQPGKALGQGQQCLAQEAWGSGGSPALHPMGTPSHGGESPSCAAPRALRPADQHLLASTAFLLVRSALEPERKITA